MNLLFVVLVFNLFNTFDGLYYFASPTNTKNVKNHYTHHKSQSFNEVQINEVDVLNYVSKRSPSLNPDSIISFKRWNSTIIEIKKVTKNELKFFSRSSFNGSVDIFETILKDGYEKNKYKNPFEEGLIVSIFVGSFISLFLLPVLPTDNANLKNFIGLFGLSLPFVYMFITTVFPTVALAVIPKAVNSQSNMNKNEKVERLCVHEAGHFLVGYLCGYPVLNYEINGDQGANLIIGTMGNTDISAPSSTMKKSSILSNVEIERLLGSLLTISMAGIVAEALVFGDSMGGIEDWPMAYQIIRQYHLHNQQVNNPINRQNLNPFTEEEIDLYLRGAVTKCLVLLRIHRASLDSVAKAMSEKRTILECIDAIETVPTSVK